MPAQTSIRMCPNRFLFQSLNSSFFDVDNVIFREMARSFENLSRTGFRLEDQLEKNFLISRRSRKVLKAESSPRNWNQSRGKKNLT